MTRVYAPYGSVAPRDRYVDAEPVRLYIRSLMSDGLSMDSVARASGVHRDTLNYILYGDHHRPPARRTREENAVRIMSVRVELRHFPQYGHIDNTVSRRKLEAMIAMGWSQKYLAERLGMFRNNFRVMLSRGRITAHRARNIRDLFNELWDKRPERLTPTDEWIYRRTITTAASYGYVTGAAWEDIENVKEPHPVRPDEDVRNETHWDEVPFLRSQGVKDEDIAKAIGVSVKTLRERDRRVLAAEEKKKAKEEKAS